MAAVEVVGVGEVLVDIIPEEPGPYREGKKLSIHFGGAPANFAVGVARLGHRSGVVACVGDDEFGKFLIDTLKREGVYTGWVKVKKARTSLAFVVLYENGERDFFFYRKPWVNTADTLLEPGDIDIEEVTKARVVHVSGVATAHPPLSETVYEIVSRAFEKGCEVSIDPNYRRDVWPDSESARKCLDRYLRKATIVTMGYDELEGIFNSRDYRSVARKLLEEYENIKYVAVRLGAEGAYILTRGGEEVKKEAFRIKPVDTTGAGDAWTAAFITFHILEGIDLDEAVTYANAVGALTCTKHGAITSLPTREELMQFLRTHGIRT